MMTFKEFGLSTEILKSLDDLKFLKPSPIQSKAIPFILKSKKDLIALAQTGTGKTVAYSLPILNQIKSNQKYLESIILCPTRELCIQISDDIKKLASHSKGILITAVYGGERIDFQIRSLKKGANIIIGTPGRVHDLIRRKVLKLQSIKWLVLDEADEMLDMGFKDDLDAILEQIPKIRQTLLFSATMSQRVRSIAMQYMTKAEEISIGEENFGAEKVFHEYYLVQPRDRFEALKRILDYSPGIYGILFCRTKREAQEVSDKLKQLHYNADVLHGDISQNIRTKIMDRFKKKQIDLLVATDVAARGIDVSNLTHIINYSFSDQSKAYVHRSGRTGRAHNSGVSISIICQRDFGKIKKLESIIGKKFKYKRIPSKEDICKKQIDHFLKDIENINIKKIENELYFLEIIDKLKKINKDDLIKYFIINKFSNILDNYKNERDLNAKVKNFSAERDDGNNASLKINFGKNHGFDVKKFFSLINSNKNLKSVEIGKINIMAEHSIFSVGKNRVIDLKKCLSGAKINGRKLEVSVSNKIVNYKRQRRNVSNKRFVKRINKPSLF